MLRQVESTSRQNSRNLLFSPANLEITFFIHPLLHQEGQKIIVDTEFIINLIQVGILALLMQKGVDKEGNLQIRWGEQQIA